VGGEGSDGPYPPPYRTIRNNKQTNNTMNNNTYYTSVINGEEENVLSVTSMLLQAQQVHVASILSYAQADAHHDNPVTGVVKMVSKAAVLEVTVSHMNGDVTLISLRRWVNGFIGGNIGGKSFAFTNNNEVIFVG